jgi:hypothetical protein
MKVCCQMCDKTSCLLDCHISNELLTRAQSLSEIKKEEHYDCTDVSDINSSDTLTI